LFELLSTDDSDEKRYWESHVDRFSGDYSLAFLFTAVAYFDDVGRDFAGGNLVPSILSNFFPCQVLATLSNIRLDRKGTNALAYFFSVTDAQDK
jgi:hypothetical protein